MPAGLGFIVQAILGMMGSQSLLHVGALSVRLSEGFLVLMAVCSVRSSCVLYLVVVSICRIFSRTLEFHIHNSGTMKILMLGMEESLSIISSTDISFLNISRLWNKFGTSLTNTTCLLSALLRLTLALITHKFRLVNILKLSTVMLSVLSTSNS